jgi:5,10-methylene-tetrahydrofolate dehydrogenase/methenyl tetrahydrofolate cyclohydrolase
LAGLFDFIPATPRAVVNLLKYYGFANFKGKKIAILGQSNLV